MQRLSASDAIQPAWDYTRAFLFTPRRWGTLLKIATVAVLANLGGGSGGSGGNPGIGSHSAHPLTRAAMLLIFAIVGVAVVVIGLALLYVSSRMQFVLFDVMLRRETLIAPIWRRYARQTWRWIGFKLLLFLCFFLCLAVCVVPLIFGILHASHNGGIAAILLVVFAVLAMVIVVLALVVVYTLASDFSIPFVAVGGLRVSDALRQVAFLARAEPGQFALYLLLRVLLGLVCAIAAYAGILLVALVLAIPLGLAGYGLWAALHTGNAAAQVGLYATLGLLAVLFLAPVIVAALVTFGYTFCFIEAYALFFLGGRYSALGQILVPGPVAPPPSPLGWQPLTSYTG